MENKSKDIIEIGDKIASLTSPSKVIDMSNAIATIINKKGLAMALKGKKYVMVEGWQLAGAMFGLYPIVEKIENLSEGNTVRYRAEVTLRDQEDRVVGTGMAICTNKEKGKEAFAEYAVASMAQTRAVGKAMRLKIGWVMKLAGFQGTPSEEVGQDGAIEEANVVEEKDWVDELSKATNIQELYKTWLAVPKDLRPELESYKEELKAKLGGKES